MRASAEETASINGNANDRTMAKAFIKPNARWVDFMWCSFIPRQGETTVTWVAGSKKKGLSSGSAAALGRGVRRWRMPRLS
jgi:hypothetical protein